jgi:hypothetical protein
MIDCPHWRPIKGKPHMGTCEQGYYGGKPSEGACKLCDNGKHPLLPRDDKAAPRAKPDWKPPKNMDPEAQFGCKGCGG